MRCSECNAEMIHIKKTPEGMLTCPICKKQYMPVQSQPSGEKAGTKRNRIMIAALIAAVVAALVILYLIFRPGTDPDTPSAATEVTEEPAKEDTGTPEENTPDSAKAGDGQDGEIDTYYEEHGTIVNRINAVESANVRTESEIVPDMGNRGFSQYPVTSEYAMNGQYTQAADVSAVSDKKHPMYTTYYIAANGDIWTINEINGHVTAFPVTYNMNSGSAVQVIISETETIMSYDSGTNRFYETIPDPSALIVKTVSHIDAETLDRLSGEGVDSI